MTTHCIKHIIVELFNRTFCQGLSLLFLSIISCTSQTEVHRDITNKLLPNGQLVRVEKSSTHESTKGIFGHHTFNITHTYQYNVSLDKEDCWWEVSNGEPKHFLFCKDTLYIHYLKEKYLRIHENTDTLLVDGLSDYQYIVKDVYEFYLDKRYFFNLFGDVVWVDIPKEKYEALRNVCDEFGIPNDDELQWIRTEENGMH